MSGFLFSSAPLDAARWGKALHFSPDARTLAAACPPFAGVLVRLDQPALWDPATDAATRVTVFLAGRLNLDPDDWERARHLPHAGGLACRHLLDRWLRQPGEFAAALDGACCAIVFDPRESALHLFTDRMGVFPVYKPAGGPVHLCSHPDVLADLLASEGRDPPLDALTMAECLQTGMSVHDFTYYDGVRQLDAATHYRWRLESGGERWSSLGEYWRPARGPAPAADAGKLAEELAAAFRRAGLRRDPAILGRSGLLLSGGADSRTLLFSAPDPAAVESFTFCDRVNSEAEVARRIAAAAGAPHHLLCRTPEHYGLGAWESVRISGGMWSIKDCHFHGFLPTLREAGLGHLMTGCYADYLLKGLSFNRKPRTFLGKGLPLDDLAPFSFDYYQPFCSIAPHWAERVRGRLEERFPPACREAYETDSSAVEELRLRPLSREADAMGRLFLLRTLPWDPVLVDNGILALLERIPPRLKLNGRVFRAAVGLVVPAAAKAILNNNDHSPVDAPEPLRIAAYVLHKARQMIAKPFSRRQPPSLATDTSWPDFGYYVANSKVVVELWNSPSPAQREILGDLLGEDPWARSLAEWGRRDVDLILRLLTLRIWLTQRGI